MRSPASSRSRPVCAPLTRGSQRSRSARCSTAKISPARTNSAPSESNDGGDPRVLPVYRTIVLNTQITGVAAARPPATPARTSWAIACFLRFENDAPRLVTIRHWVRPMAPARVAATDPDIFVFRRGQLVASAQQRTCDSETIVRQQLAGRDLYHRGVRFRLTGTNAAALHDRFRHGLNSRALHSIEA